VEVPEEELLEVVEEIGRRAEQRLWDEEWVVRR